MNGMTRLANRSQSARSISIGGALVKAGILMQMGVCVLFLGITAHFHRRCIQRGVCTSKIQRILNILYASTALIMIRGIYAIVVTFEALSKDHVGPFIKSEVPFYVMDVAVMLVNTFMLNVFHPARYLPRDHKVYLAKDGRTELVGPGWWDKRPLIVTVLDPFDLVGLLTGRDKKNAFWDRPEDEVQRENRKDEVPGEKKDEVLGEKKNDEEVAAGK